MPAPAAVSNRLLNALSSAARLPLQAKLTAVPMPVNTPIFSPDNEPKFAYFMTSGIASVVTDMEDGSVVEVGLLGRESLTNSLHLLGPQHSSRRCFMQVGGTGLRIAHKDLVQCFRSNLEFHDRVLQQVQYEALTLSQLSACNRLHEIEERLARWLLLVSDRLEDDHLPLTQEFLAEMLGARRSSVTVSAGTLQRAGLIEYRRGNVRILDRDSLQQAACECYPGMRRVHKNLFTDPVRAA